MIQRGQIGSQTRLIIGVDRRHNRAGTARQAFDHYSPRIDNHAIAISFPAINVIAALSWCNNIRHVFDGARAHQNFPMRLSGNRCKCRWRQDNINFIHQPEQFRKPQIVAYRQADSSERRVYRDYFIPRLDGFLLGITFMPQLQTEQMNFVVTGYLLAVIRINQTAIINFIRIRRSQRHRSPHQPDLRRVRSARRGPEPRCGRGDRGGGGTGGRRRG